MFNNLEIEYKQLVSEEQFNQLSNQYPNKKFIRQTNTYYDTSQFDLRNQGCALRIREKENKFLITLKTPAVHGHHEFECFVEKNDPSMFKLDEIKSILTQLNITSSLIEIGTCTTYRAVVKTDKAELCFDINEYNNIRDYEIEYEQTCDHDGKSEFNKILKSIGLVYEKNCASKIKRTLDSK